MYVFVFRNLEYRSHREYLLFQAIATNPARVDVARAMEAVSNPATGGGASFINGTTMNKVQRSKYGRKAVSNTTREIGQAKNLGNATSGCIVLLRSSGF